MKNISKIVGNTPLMQIEGILAKMEMLNPTGSIKDRMVFYMAEKAEKRGDLKPGAKIIEVTSGNTGISLAALSAQRGYKFTAVMPESMSEERVKIMEAFGARIVLTPKEKDMAGAVEKYKELASESKAWLPKQFENPDNVEAYKEGLGKEIIEQTGGNIQALVAGVGTGGTLIGVALALKKINPKIKIVALEPKESAVLSGQRPGLHKIQGIGEGFIPEIVKKHIGLIDEIMTVESCQALEETKNLAKTHGILAGTSSGANLSASKRIKEKYGFKKVLTFLPDGGERYLSEN